MKSLIRTITVTGGLAVSLLIGAGSTSASENDSLFNLNGSLVENLNITDSNAENKLDLQNSSSDEAKFAFSDKLATVNADGKASLKSKTVVEDTVSSETEAVAEGSVSVGVKDDSSSDVKAESVNKVYTQYVVVQDVVSSITNGATKGTNETGVAQKNSAAVNASGHANLMSEADGTTDIVSFKTEGVVEGTIGAGVDSKDSSVALNPNGSTGLKLENGTVVEEDSVSLITSGDNDTSLNSFVEYKNSCLLLELKKTVSIVNGVESNLESDSASLTSFGNETVTNIGLSSSGTESSKVMSDGSALIETQIPEVSFNLETDVNVTSVTDLKSFSTDLNGTASLSVYAKDDQHSSDLGLDLSSQFAAMSEIK